MCSYKRTLTFNTRSSLFLVITQCLPGHFKWAWKAIQFCGTLNWRPDLAGSIELTALPYSQAKHIRHHHMPLIPIQPPQYCRSSRTTLYCSMSDQRLSINPSSMPIHMCFVHPGRTLAFVSCLKPRLSAPQVSEPKPFRCDAIWWLGGVLPLTGSELVLSMGIIAAPSDATLTAGHLCDFSQVSMEQHPCMGAKRTCLPYHYRKNMVTIPQWAGISDEYQPAMLRFGGSSCLTRWRSRLVHTAAPCGTIKLTGEQL